MFEFSSILSYFLPWSPTSHYRFHIRKLDLSVLQLLDRRGAEAGGAGERGEQHGDGTRQDGPRASHGVRLGDAL